MPANPTTFIALTVIPARARNNTSTTIITVLMVFIIQNSQNRDAAALQIIAPPELNVDCPLCSLRSRSAGEP